MFQVVTGWRVRREGELGPHEHRIESLRESGAVGTELSQARWVSTEGEDSSF